MAKSPLVWALLAAFLFGAATPVSKSLLHYLPPFQLAGWLYLGAAVGALPLLVRRGSFRLPWAFDRQTRLNLLWAIGLGGILGPVLLLLGLKLASAASVSLWLNLELIATITLGYFFFRDPLTPYGWIASGAMLTAAALLSVAEGPAGLQAGLLVALACLCWGVDNHLTAMIHELSPAEVTFWKGSVAGITNLVIGGISETFGGPVRAIGLAVLVGSLSYGVSVLLYVFSARRLGAVRSQIIFSSSPFFGVLLAAAVLGERIAVAQMTAIAIILVSLLFLFLEQHLHAHHHEEAAHEHWHVHDEGHHEHVFPGIHHGFHHTHFHEHEATTHVHPHWPDLDHRHGHGGA